MVPTRKPDADTGRDDGENYENHVDADVGPTPHRGSIEVGGHPRNSQQADR